MIRGMALIILLFLITAMEVIGQEKLFGYYSSNTAELGFFVTKLQLNSDSTFKYEFSGDMSYNKGTGIFTADKSGRIHLTFDPEPASMDLIAQALSNNEIRPQQLLYQNGKLYIYRTDGIIVKRGLGLSRRRKFLVIGDHYLTCRKMFLKKRQGKTLIWRGEKAVTRD